MDSVDMFSTPNKKFPKNLSPTQQIILQSQFEHKKVITPTSIKRRTGPLHLFNTICNTPPSRFPRIINPFEAALADRLHLPLICRYDRFMLKSITFSNQFVLSHHYHNIYVVRHYFIDQVRHNYVRLNLNGQSMMFHRSIRQTLKHMKHNLYQ